MGTEFTTGRLPPGGNSRAVWQDTVSRLLFDLDIESRRPHFTASLDSYAVGRIAVLHIKADPAEYRRTQEHLKNAGQEAYLITLNSRHPVRFRQLGREAVCGSHSFVLELSHEPYCFAADMPMDVWVLKVPKPLLKEYVRHPERYCAWDFDGRSGLGLLFRRHALNAAYMAGYLNGGSDLLEKQLLELFAHTVAGDQRILASADSSVRAAHLARIEQFVHTHLGDNALSPERVAQACGISVRYLHYLFRDTGSSFSDWLRGRRLSLARQHLCEGGFSGSLAQLAYSLGFTDQSHFSKVYRRHFGETPRDTLQRGKG